jgi:hypothetical protein
MEKLYLRGLAHRKRALKAKDRSLRQLLHRVCLFPVGAAEGCDLLILLFA